MHYFTFRHKHSDIQDELNYDSFDDFKDNYQEKKKKWLEINEKIKIAKTYNENSSSKKLMHNYDRELLNFYHICYSPYNMIIFNRNNFYPNFIYNYIIPYISTHNDTPIIRYTNFEYIFGLIDNYMENQNNVVKFEKIYENVIENDPITSMIFNKKIFNSFHYFVNKKSNKNINEFPSYISKKMIINTFSEGFKIYTHLLKGKEKQENILEIINLFNLKNKIIRNNEALEALEKIIGIDKVGVKRLFASSFFSQSFIDLHTENKSINNISLPKDHIFKKVYVIHKLSIITQLTDLGYLPYQINDLLSNILDTSYKTVEKHINKINSLNTKDSQLENEWYNEYLLKLKNLKSKQLQNIKEREMLGFMLKNL